MNPNGRIPVINDNGFILYESNAIIRYLWKKNSLPNYEVHQLQSWATQDQWMDWTSATLYYPSFRDFYLFFARTPPAQRDKIRGEQLLSNVLPLLTIADKELKQKKYIASDDFSMADIPFGVLIDKWERINQAKNQFTNVSRYYELLLTRPFFKSNVVKFSLDAI